MAGVLLIGLSARLFGLGTQSVWFDEAASVGFAALPVPALLNATAADVNPPVYYLLLHAWLPLASDDAWLRLPSAVCSAAAIGMTVWLGKTMFNWWTGLFAGLLAGLSSFHVALGQEARAYGLLTLLGVTCVYVLWQARVYRTWKWWLAFVGLMALALYTHNYALLLEVGLAAWLGIAMLRDQRWDVSAMLACVATGVLYLPWVPAVLGQLGNVRADYWIEPPDAQTLWATYFAFIASTPPAHGWGMDPLSRSARWGILVVLGLSLVSAFAWVPATVLKRLRGARHVVARSRVSAAACRLRGWLWRPETQLMSGRARSATRLLALAAAGPTLLAVLVSVWLVPVFVVRYATFALPLFWLLVARGVGLLPVPLLRWLVGLVVLAAVGMNLPPLYTDPFYRRADLRTAALTVKSLAAADDVVVHTTPFTQYPFAYYDKNTLEDVVIASGDRTALQRTLQTHRAVWYVVSYSVQDPTAASISAQAVMDELRDWQIVQRYDFAGVQVYLVTRHPGENPA